MATKETSQLTIESDVLQNEKPTIVYVWAEWCGPCRALKPIMEDLSERIEVFKLDADANPEFMGEHNISSVPTLLVFDGGRMVKRVTGAKPKPALEMDFAEYLN
jgi:thioredoxin 1